VGVGKGIWRADPVTAKPAHALAKSNEMTKFRSSDFIGEGLLFLKGSFVSLVVHFRYSENAE